MIARKIYAMHVRYGTIPEKRCADCPHFIEGYYHDRKYQKCTAYGVSHSEATDWRKKWTACGLVNVPDFDEACILDRIKVQREHIEQPVPGQLTIEEVLDGTF